MGAFKPIYLIFVFISLFMLVDSINRPHIISAIIDDLGYYDTQVYNPDAPTPFIGKLAKEGIILNRHYAYMYCSPTRRSFLSGRFPTSINTWQAKTCDNLLPTNFTLISSKLKSVGYATHFIGKGHLGYPTTDHLPINRGFDTHVGYLGGAESYHQAEVMQKDFWHDDHPGTDVQKDVYYSTNYYTDVAVDIIDKHDSSTPLYIHLPYQGVHGPFEEPPIWEQLPNSTTFWDQTYGSMLSVLDSGIANITKVLKNKGMWNNTLFIFFADNGGDGTLAGPTNNYPLRGHKTEPWEGGVRVAAFVAGGIVPISLRGSNNSAFSHVADWYPTICNLAGADPNDTVMYNGTSRPIDGLDLWPVLMGQKKQLDREWLPTTNQSLIWRSRWKLIVAAPSTHWFTPTHQHIEDGWPCRARGIPGQNWSQGGVWDCMVCSDNDPCLFDIIADPCETEDIAKQHPNMVEKLFEYMKQVNFNPYTEKPFSGVDAAPYTCMGESAAKKQWWGNYMGPCCKPKNITEH